MKALTVATAVLIGCSHPPYPNFSDTPPRFVAEGPPDDTVSIIAGAKQWERCGVPIDIVADRPGIPNPESRIPIISTDVPITKIRGSEDAIPNCPCDGYTPPGTWYIEYNRFTYEGVEIVVAHEVGHVLGLSHHTEDGIMNPDWVGRNGKDARVTEADCNALRRLR